MYTALALRLLQEETLDLIRSKLDSRFTISDDKLVNFVRDNFVKLQVFFETFEFISVEESPEQTVISFLLCLVRTSHLQSYCNRNRNLKTSEAPLESQEHDTSLFTSAAVSGF